MEVTTATLDELACLAVVNRLPLRDDGEASLDLQQVAQNERPGLRGWVFQREHLQVLVASTKIPAVGLKLRVAELNVQCLRRNQLRVVAFPVLIVQCPVQDAEGVLGLQ